MGLEYFESVSELHNMISLDETDNQEIVNLEPEILVLS